MKPQIQITLIITIAVLLLAGGIGYIYIKTTTLENTISVNGEAILKAKPDVLTIYFNIETKGNSAQEAKDNNAKIVNNIIEKITKDLIEKEKISTENYNIYEDYIWENNKQKFVGYKASYNMKIELNSSEIEKAGKIIDIGVNEGAKLSYINFELSKKKENEYKAKALEEASKDARIKADSISAGLGKKVKEIKSISALEFNYYPWRVYESSVGDGVVVAKESLTNILPSEREINARVNIVFSIK
ncbi:MAG: SIMPL domain-containing protein [Candidatus Pacearchaeota archaeon]|nr:SIMPL domain-containing protein [Candidatus Pacearchaeota archaeon]